MDRTGDLAEGPGIDVRARLTAAVVPSRSQRIGQFALYFAGIYLFVLAVENLAGGSALATGDTETLRFAPVLVVLAVVTLVIMTGLVLPARGRGGRGHRIVGQALMYLGIVAGLAPMLADWVFNVDTRWWFWVLWVVGMVLVFAGIREVIVGARPAQEAWYGRLGAKYLYRERWLGLPLRIAAGLWPLVGIVYAIILATSDWDLQFGGYVAAVLLGLGAIGAAIITIRHGGRQVLVDTEGRIFEPNQVQFLG